MKRRTQVLIAAGAIVAASGATAGIAVAGGAGDPGDAEAPITGDALQRASEAALAHTGGGEVTETEVGDEESYYEVEVRLDNGKSVDVQLDEDFNVVGSEGDGANEDETENESGQDD